jgi:hypothetical protein
MPKLGSWLDTSLWVMVLVPIGQSGRSEDGVLVAISKCAVTTPLFLTQMLFMFCY